MVSLLVEVSDGEKGETPLPASNESSFAYTLVFPGNECHFSHMQHELRKPVCTRNSSRGRAMYEITDNCM